MTAKTNVRAGGPSLKVALAALMIAGIAGAALTASTHVEGGAVGKVFAKIGTDPTYPGFSFGLIPGATRAVNIPAGGDTVIATFTAVCKLNGTTDPIKNWVQLEIRDNNVPIVPTGDPVSPVAFCSSKFAESASVQVAKRLSSGQHFIQVFAKTVRTNSDSLGPVLSDWSLTILQAN